MDSVDAREQNGQINLDHLRHYRGSNDAVVEISSPAQQQEFLTVIKGSGDQSRHRLMEEIFKNFSGSDYGDNQWSKYTGGWTTPKVSTLYGEFRDNYTNLDPLSLDAGFITHLPEFFESVKGDLVNDQNYLDFRKRFSEKLGSKIVWRGMMLTEAELENIKNIGIVSNFASFLKTSSLPKEEFEAKFLSTYIDELIERHFHSENRLTPFISVSSHKEVAISVGRCFGNKSEGRKFYLFKMNIPEIDRIYYTEHGIKEPYKLRESPHILSISVDGENSEFKFDKDAESYLFWKIDPQEIIEITQPEVKESSWNGRKTVF